MNWLAEVTEFVPYSCSEELNRWTAQCGSWEHTHRFTSQVRGSQAGTLIGDDILYSVGFGWLGALIRHSAFISPSSTFAYQQDRPAYSGGRDAWHVGSFASKHTHHRNPTYQTTPF